MLIHFILLCERKGLVNATAAVVPALPKDLIHKFNLLESVQIGIEVADSGSTNLLLILVDPKIENDNEKHRQSIFHVVETCLNQLIRRLLVVHIKSFDRLLMVIVVDLQVCLEDSVLQLVEFVTKGIEIVGWHQHAYDTPCLGGFRRLFYQGELWQDKFAVGVKKA